MTDARPHRLVRERDLPAYVGLKRTQISELIRRGEFPRPIKLSEGGHAKAWLEDEVLSWQIQRLANKIWNGECRRCRESSSARARPGASVARSVSILCTLPNGSKKIDKLSKKHRPKNALKY